MPIDTLLSCAGDCVDLEAVAHDGNAPYHFEWEDGSTSPKRHLCATTSGSISITVTDTAITSSEFEQNARTVGTKVALTVDDCNDAGSAPGPDKTQQHSTGRCHEPKAASCKLGDGVVLPEELSTDIPGATVRYYGGGAALPAGRYRLTYIDGCDTFGDPSNGLGLGWTIHASTTTPGLVSCYLVGDDGVPFTVTPGTVGAFIGGDPAAGGGGYATYAECVAANCDDPPLDFDFKGGKLGVGRDGGGVLGAIDDFGGELGGGTSPTFRLTLLDPCP
jgi:hypothetical protein